MNKKKSNIKWYESGNAITTAIIFVILAAIICSQSFAIAGDSSFSIITGVMNHNSLYLVVLVYFVLLKTKFGKRYFNYLNVFLVFFYFIALVAAFLTLVQSFSLNTILGFFENAILVLYLFHTLFRDTRVWKEFHLGDSPFNEFKNDSYYYALLVLVVFNLTVNLISTVVISGLFISILDAVYILLLGRYVYLYREYLDYHDLDTDNEGNFQEIKENITSNLNDVRDAINEVLDKTDVDEKVGETVNKVKDATQNILDQTEIDEKIIEASTKVKETIEQKRN